MKNYFLFVFFLLNILFCYSQEKYNYITSNYYQYIYEAEVAFLLDDEDDAYEKLKQAEEACPLIEQDKYCEMSRYVKLLIKKEEYEKALKYIEILVSEYGYNPQLFESYENFDSYSKKIKWQDIKPKLQNKYAAYYNEDRQALVDEIWKMYEKDQSLRKGEFSEFSEERIEEMNEIDDCNAKRFIEIINKYGFPSLKVLGAKNKELVEKIRFPMFMHYCEQTELISLTHRCLAKGEADPFMYGLLADRREQVYSPIGMERKEDGKVGLKIKDKYWIYGVWNNEKDREIVDIENLDKRRLSIGLAPRSLFYRIKYLKCLNENKE